MQAFFLLLVFWFRRTLIPQPETAGEEDGPFREALETQRQHGPPFYCGTIFCGHETMRAAAQCWDRHCARIQETKDRFAALIAEGKPDEAHAYREGANQLLYPHLNPANWPINRPLAALRAEYVERARAERAEAEDDAILGTTRLFRHRTRHERMAMMRTATIMGVVALTTIVLAAAAHAGEPCEDESGFVFPNGPTSFVDGLRPDGRCAPVGEREQVQARRRRIARETEPDPADEAAHDAWLLGGQPLVCCNPPTCTYRATACQWTTSPDGTRRRDPDSRADEGVNDPLPQPYWTHRR